MTSDPTGGAPQSYNSGKEEALERQFDVVIERDEEGYYVASVPQLLGCHTQAQSLDSLMERIREAIELRLEVQGAPSRDLEFVGVQRVTIASVRS
jgi:predicted RNase H-like HicB family nuclease